VVLGKTLLSRVDLVIFLVGLGLVGRKVIGGVGWFYGCVDGLGEWRVCCDSGG
jgi:hypothetical protein